MGRPIARQLGAVRPQMFFSPRSRLVCRHQARPRPDISKPDCKDGLQWAPHLTHGRQSNSETREQEFKSLLAEIRRVASEVRDAKRFNVYKQMHEESNQMSQ